MPNGTYSMRFNSVKESRRHVDFGFIVGNSQAKVVFWPWCNLPSFVTEIEFFISIMWFTLALEKVKKLASKQFLKKIGNSNF